MDASFLLSPFLGKILLAALLGGIVGAERDINGRPAGLRTNLIIAVSSCLFTIMSIEGLGVVASAVDPTHIAGQIVTGVGFLGAGALIHNQDRIHGLTTAADIWFVAAIGMAVGAGFYAVSIVTTFIVVCAVFFLAPVSHWLENQGRKRMKAKGIVVEE